MNGLNCYLHTRVVMFLNSHSNKEASVDRQTETDIQDYIYYSLINDDNNYTKFVYSYYSDRWSKVIQFILA